MDDGHAKVKMEEVKKHIDETYFAWIGGRGEDAFPRGGGGGSGAGSFWDCADL